MRSKIAVVGEKESVLGFKAVGFDVYEVSTPDEAEATVHRLAGGGFGIIFITEQTLVHIPHVMEKYKVSQTPAIIPIPGREGPIGIGMNSVRKSVERAVGADILFKDE